MSNQFLQDSYTPSDLVTNLNVKRKKKDDTMHAVNEKKEERHARI